MLRIASTCLVAGMLVLPWGCGDDDYAQGCASDADCKVVASCCDGCFAVTQGELLDPCDVEECAADPCQTRFGTANRADLEPFCNADGLCGARVRATN